MERACPIHIGLPGPVPRTKLLRVSAKIGVGDSLRFLRTHGGWLRRTLGGDFDPDPLVHGLEESLGYPRPNVGGFHIFTFNDLEGTERWRQRALALVPTRRLREGAALPVEIETIRTVELPTRLVHGTGAIARLGEVMRELGVTRPLLVTDPGVAAAGLAERALEHLDGAVVFDHVRPNPDIALVDEGAALYAESGCDGLVGLGGGSSHGHCQVDRRRRPSRRVDRELRVRITTRSIERIPPLVAIPTTAGTGSEVTLWAVITDHERKIKFNVGGTPLIGAHVALVDPELMLGLPPAVTAATGMDALSHAIECYTCDYHQPFNDAVALQAIELVAAWLRPAVEDGSNLEARTHMAHAATLGGMAYGTESAGAAHAMSQSAGGVHDCPHGALTARVLGPVMEHNAPADPGRHARIAQGLGVETSGMSPIDAARAGVDELYRLTDDVGIPTMQELGFSEEEIPMLARIAFEDPQTIGNAREVDVAAYEEIYRNAFSRGKR